MYPIEHKHYLRICQECWHQQKDINPLTLSTSAFESEYLWRRCENCDKQGHLNFGTPLIEEKS